MYFCKRSWLLVAFIAAFSVACSGPKGFDEICLIYTEAKSQYTTKEAMSEYIFANIKARINSSAALEAHSAILSLSADQRYPIFKEAATVSLKRDWDCQVMKEMWGTK